MKKLLLLLPLIILFSCSVQKRKYQNGYYVSWHSKSSIKENSIPSSRSEAAKKQAVPGTPVTTITQEDPKEISASAETDLSLLSLKKNNRFAPPEDSCDVLVFRDGAEIKGKVSEVGVSEIKYKRCDASDGPTYISKKSELFMIKYSNGTREVIRSEAPPQQQTQIPAKKPGSSVYRSDKYKRQNHPLAMASLIFGVISVVLLYALGVLATGGFGVGFLILPFLAGLAAVITGKTAFNRIREQPDVWKGKGLAMPGFIMGISVVGIYLIVLTIVALLLLLV